MPTRSRRPAKRIRHSADQKRAILRRFQQSGLSPAEFCRREGLSLSTFQRWRHDLTAGPTPQGFVELLAPAEADPTTGSWSLELDLPGGLCLRIRGGR
jgi:transposase-like protein